ncbi:sugar-binding cellulase-like protein [Haloactinopolyspora alba]|uniref:Sugar-binding cellulase-like protein n=1 Tax=Haloactinopolyspora alba TaxID=648780 RepID=A0A2P8EGB5_9ACTN|nr:cellulase-like family protein [Haloactinopolyspora alba]PSL08492.1 sugar-binding cellulase-like protein [Haloactinopolyspora alba]
MTVPLADHLPDRMTISLWDFTWYTRTSPGEPFENLDAAFSRAVELGYDTVRICAMPFLLFGSGLDTSALTLGSLGGDYGQRTRWYDVKHTTTIDAREHLLEFFRAAKRHDCYVIVSSWEYQQSPSFATDRAWFDALMAVDPEDRAPRLADAHADLIDLLEAHGLADRVAFVELHNEVQGGYLTEGLPADESYVVGLKPRLTRGIERFKSRHADVPVTVNYARVPVGELRGVPDHIDVAVFHPYVYGVLDALNRRFGVRGPAESYPQDEIRRTFLRPGAPDQADWAPPAADRWKLQATMVRPTEVYLHDWCDTEAYDRWLYDHYGEYRVAMDEKLVTWIEAAADFALSRGVPMVLGEGWVGYTPLGSWFEEGPVGAEICRLAVRTAANVGARGTVICSNAAPHHAMWGEAELQSTCNETFRKAPTGSAWLR